MSKRLTAVLLGSSLCVSYVQAECTNDDLPSIDSVQSLEQVFDAVARRGTDQVIRADLTAQGVGNVCIWVYEVKLLSSSGKVTNVVYDASALRMIGFRAPQSGTETEESNGLLRGIGQRFGFFGRRDPSSEGRADSNRGDGSSSTAAASGGGSNTDSSATDTADTTSGDDATGAGGIASDTGANSNTDGESGSSGSSGASGSTGSGGASSGGSGGSANSSGSSN